MMTQAISEINPEMIAQIEQLENELTGRNINNGSNISLEQQATLDTFLLKEPSNFVKEKHMSLLVALLTDKCRSFNILNGFYFDSPCFVPENNKENTIFFARVNYSWMCVSNVSVSKTYTGFFVYSQSDMNAEKYTNIAKFLRQLQPNANFIRYTDCKVPYSFCMDSGLVAIAQAIALCNELHPGKIQFNGPNLQSHYNEIIVGNGRACQVKLFPYQILRTKVNCLIQKFKPNQIN
jgi:hypothetical protein